MIIHLFFAIHIHEFFPSDFMNSAFDICFTRDSALAVLEPKFLLQMDTVTGKANAKGL